jgi:16S rRNA G1207 methylase RsmC
VARVHGGTARRAVTFHPTRNSMTDISALKRDIIFQANLRGFEFVFHSTWGLFCPREIDDGTRLLLDVIDVGNGDTCLDLGCGYGPIGLTMARLSATGTTVMVDKDFVAVEYAKKNTELNQLKNCEILGIPNSC